MCIRDRHESALRQCAVADLAAAGAAGCAGLADGVRREIVVMDVALGLLVGQVIHELVVLGADEGAGGEHLSLAAGEHTGTCLLYISFSLSEYHIMYENTILHLFFS